jgi:hypothetical protein
VADREAFPHDDAEKAVVLLPELVLCKLDHGRSYGVYGERRR